MKRADVAALALILLSMLRIASAWTVFSATVDEPMHISAALELYTQHRYDYQPENPPLPRLVLGLAPFLGGMDFDPSRHKVEQLLNVFSSDGAYERNLVLARCGNLLFFALAAIATWLWARRTLGGVGGFAATLLFTLQPMVVGHSGVATHDAAATAGVALSLLAFSRWLDEPRATEAALAGAAFGIAVLCKFSCIGYVPAAWAAMFLVRRLSMRRERREATAVEENVGSPQFAVGRRTLPPTERGLPADCLLPTAAATQSTILLCMASAAGATLFVITLGYGFHLETFVAGIRGLADIGRAGTHFGYLFGELSTEGWWYYFPIALGVKATVASLLLALTAITVVRRRQVAAEALAAAAAILLVAMPSSLDLGVRYVLPLFGPLSVAGAAAAISLRRQWIAIVLLAWHAGASVAAHPDSIPYFNEVAGRQPWLVLSDSNIDWGQDVLRLRRVLRERKVDRVGLAVFGWHRWDELGFPPHYDAYPTLPTQGWVAVSEHLFQVKKFDWLRGRRYDRIGKSIRLYYVP